MPTGMELLQRTVEELKKVPFKDWKYKLDGNLSSYTYFPPAMRATVCRREDEFSSCYYMEVKDIAKNKVAVYPYVESLYHHLEAQRAKNKNEPPPRANLLLEQLLEAMK